MILQILLTHYDHILKQLLILCVQINIVGVAICQNRLLKISWLVLLPTYQTLITIILVVVDAEKENKDCNYFEDSYWVKFS